MAAAEGRAAGQMLLAGGCFRVLQAFVSQCEDVPRLLLAEARTAFCALVAAVALFHRKDRWQAPLPPLLLRGALVYGFLLNWWGAVRHAPLGDCVALLYLAPLLSTAWSRLALGVPLPEAAWLRAVLALLGTALIACAGAGGGLGGYAPERVDYRYSFAAVLFSSIIPVATQETRRCSWPEVVASSGLLSCALLNPLVLFALRSTLDPWPSVSAMGAWELALMLLSAVCLLLSMFFEIRGQQLSEPGRPSILVYAEVPLAYLLQHCRAKHAVRGTSVMGSLLLLSAAFLGVMEQQGRRLPVTEADVVQEPLDQGAPEVESDYVQMVDRSDDTGAGVLWDEARSLRQT